MFYSSLRLDLYDVLRIVLFMIFRDDLIRIHVETVFIKKIKGMNDATEKMNTI